MDILPDFEELDEAVSLQHYRDVFGSVEDYDFLNDSDFLERVSEKEKCSEALTEFWYGGFTVDYVFDVSSCNSESELAVIRNLMEARKHEMPSIVEALDQKYQNEISMIAKSWLNESKISVPVDWEMNPPKVNTLSFDEFWQAGLQRIKINLLKLIERDPIVGESIHRYEKTIQILNQIKPSVEAARRSFSILFLIWPALGQNSKNITLVAKVETTLPTLRQELLEIWKFLKERSYPLALNKDVRLNSLIMPSFVDRLSNPYEGLLPMTQEMLTHYYDMYRRMAGQLTYWAQLRERGD